MKFTEAQLIQAVIDLFKNQYFTIKKVKKDLFIQLLT